MALGRSVVDRMQNEETSACGSDTNVVVDSVDVGNSRDG